MPAAAGEHERIDARQGCQLLRQIRCKGDGAGLLHLVGNGQLAPLKINVRPGELATSSLRAPVSSKAACKPSRSYQATARRYSLSNLVSVY